MDEDDLPLRASGELILPNLRDRLKKYLTTYELKEQFLENVFPWDIATLDNYLESREPEKPGCYKAFHFQIHDFLRLSEVNKGTVLKGEKLEFNYFEKPNKLTPSELVKKFTLKVRSGRVELRVVPKDMASVNKAKKSAVSPHIQEFMRSQEVLWRERLKKKEGESTEESKEKDPDGHFKKPRPPTEAEIAARAARKPAPPQRIDTFKIAQRLNYLLLRNRWTRSQFAHHVLGHSNGESAAHIIERIPPLNHSYYRSIYLKILAWLEKSDEERRIQIDGELGDYQPDPEVPVITESEFSLANLRHRLNFYIINPELWRQFRRHVLPEQASNVKLEMPASHFQAYDFLRLSDEDKEKVLDGETPTGYFEKPNNLSIYFVKQKFDENIRKGTIQLIGDDNIIQVDNLADRLHFLLLHNHWTRTQFAYHVLGELDYGHRVARIIEHRPPHYDAFYGYLYPDILDWLQKTDRERKAQFEKVMEVEVVDLELEEMDQEPGPAPAPPVNSRKQPIPMPQPGDPITIDEVTKIHMKFLADPTNYAIDNPRFKECMLFLVDRENLKLGYQIKELQPGAVYDELDRNPCPVYLHTDILRRSLAGEPDNRFAFDMEKIKLDRLITLAFMDGAKTDLGKLGKCLNSVLGENETRKDTFARKVLDCSKTHLKNLIKNPWKYYQDVEALEKYTKIQEFLMKSSEERKIVLEEEEIVVD